MKSQNIVHMDIKPQNIMVKDPMKTTKFIIIDFGSAVSINEKHINSIQTKYYRSPEDILG